MDTNAEIECGKTLDVCARKIFVFFPQITRITRIDFCTDKIVRCMSREDV